jgi:fused signal recognition particle receptor
MDNGMTVVFSASDTFRAAAIEQAEVHATRLGITIIKSNYGADPASVAFDAINYARSHNIDAVLIDSAGRQDTNANLLDELKKMNRVAKPDIKIYIGESIGGNSIIEQIRAFNEAIGLDGAILTKIDCDAKGGTAISVSRSTGIPVLYLGIGQGYADLVPFDPHKIAQEIMT